MTALTPEDARLLADQLRLFAQPQRLLILSTLRTGPTTVADIETRTGIPQPTLSQQLGELRRADILATWRESRAVFYGLSNTLNQARITAILQLFHENIPPTPTPLQPPPAHPPQGGAKFAQVKHP